MGMTSKNELPPFMTIRKRGEKCNYYFSMKLDGIERKEIPLGQDKKHALVQYKQLLKSSKQLKEKTKISVRANIPWLAKNLLKKHSVSARHRKIEFYLTMEDIEQLFARSKGKCELTGIPFSFEKSGGRGVRIWYPSVDRINSLLGYTPDNVRLVCIAVNYAMNEFGEDVLFKIARGLIKKKTGVKV